MDRDLLSRYRFFRGRGWRVGHDAEDALALARAEKRAKELGLSVSWEDEIDPWDGDCPAPAILVCGLVYAPDETDRNGSPLVHYSLRPHVLASLGMVGLNSWRDSYVRVVEACLFSEALDALDAESDAIATVQASELASRATYAGVAT
jgi:hypothetical protein